jgi:hypothetical protein
MPLDARSVLLYEVYPQLEAFGVDGVARLLGAFSNIEAEADKVADSAFEAYGRLPGEGDMGDFADSARDEGIAYYQSLAQLKQGVTNLLAAGLYHLFEQHHLRIKDILSREGRALPSLASLESWPKVNELRLLANTVKHAEGSSASQLRAIRPDYFVDPALRGSLPEKWQLQRGDPVSNPLGGTDLFVDRRDLTEYYHALRALWEELLPHL